MLTPCVSFGLGAQMARSVPATVAVTGTEGAVWPSWSAAPHDTASTEGGVGKWSWSTTSTVAISSEKAIRW